MIFKKQPTTDAIVRSRNYFILEGITGIGQFSLTTGAFLAGFIYLLGTSDQLNGMIAVVPAITGIFQVFSPLIFERIKKRKNTIFMIALFLRVFMSSVFFIPILLMHFGIALQAFIIMYTIAYTLNALLGPAIASWMVDLTPIEIRGKYLAKRERAALVITAFMTIILGKVLDISKLSGSPLIGFMIVGIVLALLGILNIYALKNICEVSEKNQVNNYRLKEVLTRPIKDIGFRKIIFLFIIWSFALQIGGPYVSVYLVTNLKLSYTYIMALSVISTLVRVIFSSHWGRIADQKSWFLSTKLSILLLAFVHILWGFVTKGNYVILVPLLHILGGFSWGGIGISLFNIQFLYAKREGRTMYLGLNAAIGGLFSFIAVWLGGRIIEHFEGMVFKFGIFEFGNIQLVFLISGLLLTLCPLIVNFYIEKGDVAVEEE